MSDTHCPHGRKWYRCCDPESNVELRPSNAQERAAFNAVTRRILKPAQERADANDDFAAEVEEYADAGRQPAAPADMEMHNRPDGSRPVQKPADNHGFTEGYMGCCTCGSRNYREHDAKKHGFTIQRFPETAEPVERDHAQPAPPDLLKAAHVQVASICHGNHTDDMLRCQNCDPAHAALDAAVKDAELRGREKEASAVFDFICSLERHAGTPGVNRLHEQTMKKRDALRAALAARQEGRKP